MKHLIPCLVIAFCTFGCGGSSQVSTSVSTSYPGSYAGIFEQTPSGNIARAGAGNSSARPSAASPVDGALTLVIGSNDNVSGTWLDTTDAITDPITGSITSKGVLSVSIGATTASGQMVLSNGVLTGSLSSTAGTIAITVANTAGGSPYAGAYTGTFTNSDSQSGTLTLIIDGLGNLTGIIADHTSNVTNILTGTITSSGAVSLNSTAGGTADTGTFTLSKSGEMTGTLTGNGITLIITLVATD